MTSSSLHSGSDDASFMQPIGQQHPEKTMGFDLHYVPFSRYGSYLAFSWLPLEDERPAGLFLRSVHALFT
jgi:hypothetical protein